MPSDLSEALDPRDADPSSAAQLAESALHLLDPEEPGGPDYVGAARMCLLATEAADPKIERQLRQACYRVAARSALRSGDREIYIQTVDRWEEASSRTERAVGELAIHRTIRDRLLGTSGGRSARLPAGVSGLLPRPGKETR
jgi:hypothetical protein